MQQIADWLEKLGLSEYAQRFAENDIDFSILRDLTDQDLKEIGIPSLGHRRKILRPLLIWSPLRRRAIPRVPSKRRRAAAVGDAAERRQVTVMFSRPGRLDGALRPHGPGGPARDHCGLSQMRR